MNRVNDLIKLEGEAASERSVIPMRNKVILKTRIIKLLSLSFAVLMLVLSFSGCVGMLRGRRLFALPRSMENQPDVMWVSEDNRLWLVFCGEEARDSYGRYDIGTEVIVSELSYSGNFNKILFMPNNDEEHRYISFIQCRFYKDKITAEVTYDYFGIYEHGEIVTFHKEKNIIEWTKE